MSTLQLSCSGFSDLQTYNRVKECRSSADRYSNATSIDYGKLEQTYYSRVYLSPVATDFKTLHCEPQACEIINGKMDVSERT